MSKLNTLPRTLVALILVFLTFPCLAALQPGTQAPHFSTQASLDGETFAFSMQQALAQGPVVLYFFPAAFTRGCDIEAHTFAVNKDKFVEAGTTIIGVSADSIQRLNRFSADPDYCAGKFPVASDPNGEIAAHYGLDLIPPREGAVDTRGVAIEHGYIPRTTFVIDRNGAIVATFSSKTDQLTPRQHVSKSLAIVQKLTTKAASPD